MKNNRYIILSEKSWNSNLEIMLKEKFPMHQWKLINSKQDFNSNILSQFNPYQIFIPHWSYIIPNEIFEKYECIVFHMTDLPYGRGGSPLQNLIVRGKKETKISAINVDYGLDTGPVYLKKDLKLNGTAKEIFKRSSKVIFEMIVEIIEKGIVPKPQKGVPVLFKRRSPNQSDIKDLNSLDKVYDYIRMLDCDGYPKAYLETDHLKIEFEKAEIISDNELKANVRISKK